VRQVFFPWTSEMLQFFDGALAWVLTEYPGEAWEGAPHPA
jgi:hypothetical protein